MDHAFQAEISRIHRSGIAIIESVNRSKARSTYKLFTEVTNTRTFDPNVVLKLRVQLRGAASSSTVTVTSLRLWVERHPPFTHAVPWPTLSLPMPVSIITCLLAMKIYNSGMLYICIHNLAQLDDPCSNDVLTWGRMFKMRISHVL
jgi:hypothetical protein